MNKKNPPNSEKKGGICMCKRSGLNHFHNPISPFLPKSLWSALCFGAAFCLSLRLIFFLFFFLIQSCIWLLSFPLRPNDRGWPFSLALPLSLCVFVCVTSVSWGHCARGVKFVGCVFVDGSLGINGGSQPSCRCASIETDDTRRDASQFPLPSLTTHPRNPIYTLYMCVNIYFFQTRYLWSCWPETPHQCDGVIKLSLRSTVTSRLRSAQPVGWNQSSGGFYKQAERPAGATPTPSPQKRA